VEPEIASGIDLMIEDVRLLEAGEVAKNLGPLVRVTVKNNGQQAAGRFGLGVYASLQPEPNDKLVPAGQAIAELAAGKSHAVEVRLPVEALQMRADANSAPEAFRVLLIVADVANEVLENNKRNNVLPVNREQLQVATQ
jgi:hypothetical protein